MGSQGLIASNFFIGRITRLVHETRDRNAWLYFAQNVSITISGVVRLTFWKLIPVFLRYFQLIL